MEDKISETERVRLQTDDEWLEEYNTGKKVYPKKRYPKAVRIKRQYHSFYAKLC